eukprot:TRINITY_DN58359_c0_g1_i1.p2 TRINITY_DN58359_c0_g1~~TRINITY_DN58359_c0_g1_i1.p2  ORF type:complete len:145 (+),score=9.04 TRINITY_DN58359_c0_g1_i1:106-540(+)
MFRNLKYLTLETTLDNSSYIWSAISMLSSIQSLKLYSKNMIFESQMLALTNLKLLKKLHIASAFVFEYKGFLGTFKSLEVVCMDNCSIHGKLNQWYQEICNIYNLRYLELELNNIDRDVAWFIMLELDSLLPFVQKSIQTQLRA